MLKLIQALAASALMTLALSACSSIETRGLPRCSGHDRRPLNVDLWAWEQTTPRQRSDSNYSEMALRFASAKPRSSALGTIDAFALPDRPQWDIAASEQSCG